MNERKSEGVDEKREMNQLGMVNGDWVDLTEKDEAEL